MLPRVDRARGLFELPQALFLLVRQLGLNDRACVNSLHRDLMSGDLAGEVEASRERILIVDDDDAARQGLMECVRAWGYDAEGAVDGEHALAQLTNLSRFDHFGGLGHAATGRFGVAAASQRSTLGPHLRSDHGPGHHRHAVAAMKEGADDYLTKPVDPQRLRVLLNKSAERRGTLRKVNALRHQLHGRGVFDGLVGEAPAIRDVDRVIERAAPTDASVLIFGESGTGKGLWPRRSISSATGAIARL